MNAIKNNAPAELERELEREIAAYECEGSKIECDGYRAGMAGSSIASSPHPTGDWRDDVWCQGWRLGYWSRCERGLSL